MDEKSANEIYDLIIDFADYAFNKSHSVAYSVIAYRSAWIKYYYPREFMAAQISTYTSDIKQVSLYIEELKRLGIGLLPPNVNYSQKNFTVEGKKIRFGLKAVKNVGENLIEAIVQARDKLGNFTSLWDFVDKVQKVSAQVLNKKALESLIRCGALDDFDGNRAQYLAVYEKVMENNQKSIRNNIRGQVTLFGNLNKSEDLPNLKDFSLRDKLNMEKEVIGIYVSGHPLDDYRPALISFSNTNTGEIFESYNSSSLIQNKDIRIAGLLKNKKTMITKTNKVMAFASLEDLFGTIELIIFPKTYSQYKNLIEDGKVLAVMGHISSSDVEDPKIIVDSLIQIQEPSDKKLYISIKSMADKNILVGIKEVLKSYRGNVPVIFYDESQKKTYGTDMSIWINEKEFENIKLELLVYLNENPNKIILK